MSLRTCLSPAKFLPTFALGFLDVWIVSFATGASKSFRPHYRVPHVAVAQMWNLECFGRQGTSRRTPAESGLGEEP
jgi:hypothetical protein